MSDTNALAGALGSIIGYLGGEVAGTIMFERLLWPERFYNILSVRNFFEMAVFMPMGGPVHKAALKSLDVMQKKGLYYGAAHGHMLGTAFYQSKKLRYKLHNYDGLDNDNEIRNGLWSTVLQKCRDYARVRTLPPLKVDPEAKIDKAQLIRRTTQAVLHLHLWEGKGKEIEAAEIFKEDKMSFKIICAILTSEMTAIGIAVAVGWAQKCPWFAAYFCVPLVLKLISAFTSVRRGPQGYADKKAPAQFEDDPKTVIFEIDDYDHGFPLIEGSEPVIRQFFQHWGHPLRETHRDRAREVIGIILIFIFVLYFPLGLLSMLWVSQPVQIMWLSYQMYLIVVMHIMRIRGSAGRGRTEEGLAEGLVRNLESRTPVAIEGSNGAIVMARLDAHPVKRIREGREKVQEITALHAVHQKRIPKRSDTADSQTTLLGSEEEDEKKKEEIRKKI